MHTIIKKCRSCQYEHLEPILNLGETCFGGLLSEDQDEDTMTAPLVLVFCPHCSLVQINATMPREILLLHDSAYYFPSSPAKLNYFREIAQRIIACRRLSANSLVIETAGKEGYALQSFVEKGIQTIGIVPDAAAAKTAMRRGINTLNTFFSRQLAETLRDRGKRADIFIANNLPAVPDLNDTVDGLKTILKNDGLAVVEVPYLLGMIDNNQFDMICHQRLSYFTATSLDRLFRRHGLYLNHLEQTALHGGSLRVFVEPIENVQESVRIRLDFENGRGINTMQPYAEFADNVQRVRRSLKTVLLDLKESGQRIVGYGAGARATTLLNYCGIDQAILDYIVDMNPLKQGHFMCGSHLPVYSPNKLVEDMPGYVVILALNYANEIIHQQQTYYLRGGEFIIPVPSPSIINEDEIYAILSQKRMNTGEKNRPLPLPVQSPG
ncbi:methyltransferase domain-containing protein [candidate division KSB1 bacterium]|nr:methyltransferase domain-containing protein [candidate division KSB1 bacterium]RQW01172.1 MAG: methyltransferase domain-containing protein [candidate division KSB1 bacterium]